MALALERGYYCPCYKQWKKGPSSITSAKTAYASYLGNITHANQKNVRFNIEEERKDPTTYEGLKDKTQIRKWTV